MVISSEEEDHYGLPPAGYYLKRWKPHALPTSHNMDGKHVWERSILAYNDLIGEEFEKKREAVLKYTKDDRASTTEILDIGVEYDLLETYRDWAWDNVNHAGGSVDYERASFFAGLYREVRPGWNLVGEECLELDIEQKRMEDGTSKIMRCD